MNNAVNMSLEINDMVFKSILDNLYTDLPLAIVREICCNAADSHTVARNYEPFFVQQPSVENPFFIVRDFGTGLAKEDVYKYLNTLLSSNKKSETDLTGQYGLGSKAVLAYNDNYKVLSYFNGTCYEFLFKRVNKGVPTLELLSEIPTTEPNGIKYVVSVPKESIQVFNYRLHLLSTFRIPPKVFLDIDDPSTEVSVVYTKKIAQAGENFSVYQIPERTAGWSYSPFRLGAFNIRLGDVVYDVTGQVGNYHIDREYSLLYTFLNYIFPSSAFVIDMDPSSLELPLNRESIILNSSNTNLIRTNIIDAISEFLNKIVIQFNEEYSTNYESIRNFTETGKLFDILKFSRFLSDKYNCSVYHVLNAFGPIPSESLPEEMAGYSFQHFGLTQEEAPYDRLSLFTFSLFYRGLPENCNKIILTPITPNVTNLKIDNYLSRNDLDYTIIGTSGSGSFAGELTPPFFNFFVEVLSVQFPNVVVEYKSEVEMREILNAESGARARERRANSVAAQPSVIAGVRTFTTTPYQFRVPSSNVIYNNSTPVQVRLTEEGAVIPFNSSYFETSRKFLVISKSERVQNYSNVFCNRTYSFDTLLITTEKTFDSIVTSLKENENIEVYTLNTLSDYPLISQEDSDEMKQLYAKDQIFLKTASLFNLTEDNFSAFQIKLIEHVSTLENVSQILSESLENLHTRYTSQLELFVRNKVQEVGYNEAQKYQVFRNSITTNIDPWTELKDILSREFLVENKEEFLKAAKCPLLLRHYINVV